MLKTTLQLRLHVVNRVWLFCQFEGHSKAPMWHFQIKPRPTLDLILPLLLFFSPFLQRFVIISMIANDLHVKTNHSVLQSVANEFVTFFDRSKMVCSLSRKHSRSRVFRLVSSWTSSRSFFLHFVFVFFLRTKSLHCQAPAHFHYHGNSMYRFSLFLEPISQSSTRNTLNFLKLNVWQIPLFVAEEAFFLFLLIVHTIISHWQQQQLQQHQQ